MRRTGKEEKLWEKLETIYLAGDVRNIIAYCDIPKLKT